MGYSLTFDTAMQAFRHWTVHSS